MNIKYRLIVGTSLILILILTSAIAALIPYKKSGGDPTEFNRETVFSDITKKTDMIAAPVNDLSEQKDNFSANENHALNDIPPDGYVSILIVGIDGKPLDTIPPFTALLSGRMNGYELDLSKAPQGRGEGYSISVSPDSYSLMLLPTPSRNNPNENFYLPLSLEEVGVQSEQTTKVQVQVRLGGKLTITFPGMDRERIPKPLDIRVLQVGENRSRQLKAFLPDGKPPAVASDGLKPGIPYTSTMVFEPGSYHLEVTAKGQAPREFPFHIVPGQIKHITAHLLKEQGLHGTD